MLGLELDETIYGTSRFIPEYPLPAHELTYATKGYDGRGATEIDENGYDTSQDNVINVRPETRFMKKEMWPQALIDSEEFKKETDERIFRDFGVDIERDTVMAQELMSEVPSADMYSDEQCWQIEEDWRKCKLMVRRGKAKASECKKLKSDMKMCRGLAAMSRLKTL